MKSTEISLDSLGEIDEVSVDFGMSPSVAPREVKKEVLSEFDRIADTAKPAAVENNTSSESKDKTASSYSFF